MHRVSVGALRYTGEPKLNVEVDPEIVRLARALVPKAFRLNRTRYAPHITVVRNESIPDMTRWGQHEGTFIEFEYEGVVYNDDTYYWLRAFSPVLTRLRVELGLPESSEWSRAPDGFESFHVTIGNQKEC
jgi:hypothetical protein